MKVHDSKNDENTVVFDAATKEEVGTGTDACAEVPPQESNSIKDASHHATSKRAFTLIKRRANTHTHNI